jgi:flagellar basal body-associated protein FliL
LTKPNKNDILNWYEERRSCMKKLVCFIITAVIILSLPCFAVSAAYGAELTVSQAEAKTGETAEILITLGQNPGLCALGFEITFDKNVLQVVSAEFAELFSAASKRVNAGEGKIVFNAASADNINGNGTVAKIVFKVIANGFTGTAITVKPLGETGFVLHSEADHALADVTLKLYDGAILLPSAGTSTDTPVTEAPAACTHKNTASETVKAPTCSTKGVALTRCADCGISLGETELPLAEHTAGEWETVVEPTEDKEGEEVQKCTVCGAAVATKAIDKLTPDVTAPATTAPSTTNAPNATEKDNGSSTVILVVIAAIAVAGLLIAFTVFKARSDKKKRNKEYF